MAEIAFILNEEANLSRERVYINKENPLETMDDVSLIKKFRLPKSEILKLIELCSPSLERRTDRSHALPPYKQVLGALRFYGKGTFQEDGGELVGISQSSMCKSIDAVTNILCRNSRRYIQFPQTPAELDQVKSGFYSLKQKPGIIGLIDGTQICIKAPTGADEPLYVGRKTGLGHTLNVQVICDAKMKFMDIVAKWPGATHDSYIWKTCNLRDRFLNNPPNGILLGDSGYGIEPWLFTPLEDPTTIPEKRFNKFLRSLRSMVERAIGLWKCRFRRIDLSGGRILYKPLKACKIIVATAVLHNIRRDLNLEIDEEFIPPAELPIPNRVVYDENNVTIAGNEARREYIQNNFIV